MKRKAMICTAALLLICLLAGCASQKSGKPSEQSQNDTTAATGTEAPTTETLTEAPTEDTTAAPTETPTETPTEAPTEPAPELHLEGVWRSEQEDKPDNGEIVRELKLSSEGSEFLVRAGDPHSEFSYFLHGTWTLDGDILHLDGYVTDEFGEREPGFDPVSSSYVVQLEGSRLILTSLGDETAMLEDPATRIVFEAYTDTRELDMLRSAGIGDIVMFGAYEQDADEKNGKEPIEWIVLDKDGDRMLLLSRFCLDCRMYHNNRNDEVITWETCSMREWLNTEFFQTAFSGVEQTIVETVELENPANHETGIDGGNPTTDKVFLLSLDEAERYFAEPSERATTCTAYAEAHGARLSDDLHNAWWFLRTPGYQSDDVVYVSSGGYIDADGQPIAYEDNMTIRPAVWITP